VSLWESAGNPKKAEQAATPTEAHFGKVPGKWLETSKIEEIFVSIRETRSKYRDKIQTTEIDVRARRRFGQRIGRE
jgi:hypothetical protein